MKPRRLCLVSRIPGVAGPAGFQRRLAEVLTRRGHDLCYDLSDQPYDAVLVVGGTRRLGGLLAARRRGLPVVHRLNGMNWIHRRRRTGLRHALRAEANNLVLQFIRRRAATHIVYQSNFARRWWEQVHGPAPAPALIVLNGVPLETYSPYPAGPPAGDPIRLLVVEANLDGGYEIGLIWALDLGQRMQVRGQRSVELVIAGRVPAALRASIDRRAGVAVRWMGVVAPDAIPALDRSAHLLFASDVMPACPNSVVEALACGLPVVSFDTGALPELVTREAGRLVPYGGDAWRLDPPDLGALAAGALEVVAAGDVMRQAARRRAEAGLSVETMADGYLAALGWEA